MMRLNVLELEEKYAEPEFQERFADLYALRLFLANSIVSPGYEAPHSLADAISLSSAGEEWVPRVQRDLSDVSDREVIVGLFLTFYHHDLLVNVKSTDHQAIRDALNTQVLDGRIRYPWVYGRVLYDRFFDLFPAHTESLSYEQTATLLEGTAPGVFQLGDILVGPFGVLKASSHRTLRPHRSVPLWHCSDPSCSALHPVSLSTGQTEASQVAHFVREEAAKGNGPPSEWPDFFSRLAIAGQHYDDLTLEHLPWLLANAFSEEEMREIVSRLIQLHASRIRPRFPQASRFRRTLSGSPQDIAREVTKAQALHLALLISDEDIATTVEALIGEEVIKIPATETRTLRVAPTGGGWLRIVCECSRFGLRSVSPESNLAVPRLKRLLKELHKQGRDLAQLEWKLRAVKGDSVYEKLDRFLCSEDPRRVISQFVLASPQHLKRAFQGLRYGMLKAPTSRDEEERLVEKILWKLGFDIELYPPRQRLFWERLENVLQTARSAWPLDERAREAIRSAAVNLFVSLEEVLDHSLSFAAWALLSDHYGVTKFRCNLDTARRYMASRLDGRRLGSGEALALDAEGKNTLYPLVHGFAVLADLCTELVGSSRGELRRPANECPGYYDKTEIQSFPFLHKAFVLDLTDADRERMTQLLRETTATLETCGLCGLRNRIEHKRRDFPSKEDIEKGHSGVAEAIEKMEAAGLCPLIYLYAGSSIDRYGRETVAFRDYKGREIAINRPSQYSACRLPPIRVPQIIVPSMRIGESVEPMRFQFVEMSDYVQMWQDYPKRRLRVAAALANKEATAQDTELQALAP